MESARTNQPARSKPKTTPRIEVFGNGVTRVSSADIINSTKFQEQLAATGKLRELLKESDK